jgi:hypothetical protein
MDDKNDRFGQDADPNRPRPMRKPRTGPANSAITPFNRTGKLPALPAKMNFEEATVQASPFMVRLDPNGRPGEFNFVIDGPEAIAKVPAAHVMEAEASGGIPPVLYQAVDEVLGFIYGLDQQFENQGRRPRK